MLPSMSERDAGGDMNGRRPAREWNLTPEQRDHIKKQIDARIREREGDRRRGPLGRRVKRAPEQA